MLIFTNIFCKVSFFVLHPLYDNLNESSCLRSFLSSGYQFRVECPVPSVTPKGNMPYAN